MEAAVSDDLLAGFPVVIQLPVVWGEMDAYRHVNNVVYFRYFESARLEYFRRLDWFKYEEESGVGPILASTSCRFRKPLTYPDTISVAARVGAIGEDRFNIDLILVSHKLQALAAEGQGVIVTYRHHEGRKTPMPEELRRRIEALEATVN